MRNPKKPSSSRSADRRSQTDFHDGLTDGFVPLEPLDLSRIQTVDDLVRGMSKTAFGGRRIGEAAEVLEAMVRDPECFVVLTLSGAMTVAKMGLVICEMIDRGMVQAIVSTGALMAHGLVESAGMEHFKYDSRMDDHGLYKAGYDRIFDTLELERNLDQAESLVRKVLASFPPGSVLSSRLLHEKLGHYLERHVPGRGPLKSASKKKVPVYVPAFTDSELGLDMALFNRQLKKEGKPPLVFDPFLDLEDYTERIRKQHKIGIFTIGGGVPRNWAQQVGPYLEIMNHRLNSGGDFKRFHYGVRICPEPAHWGGLSGCTYSEGVSWGKFVPREQGGRWAEVISDATIAWPLVVKAVLERLKKRPNALKRPKRLKQPL